MGGAPCGIVCRSPLRASSLEAISLQCASASACEMGAPSGSRIDRQWLSSVRADRSSSAGGVGRGKEGQRR